VGELMHLYFSYPLIAAHALSSVFFRIQNAEGAHQQFKKLARLAPALPLSAPLVTDANRPT
jgi:hypothetical protein